VVLSRRKVLEHERQQAREQMRSALVAGKVVRGKVEKIEPYGAFVNLGGGIKGLLHVSNISHQRVADPAQVLTVGQEVEVQILDVKDGGERIGLGMKQLGTDPWQGIEQRYQPEQRVRGKVMRVADFGAFVELEPGVEGLVHRSQLSATRVRSVEETVKLGDQLDVRVVSVDRAQRRIALSRLSAQGVLLGSEDETSQADVAEHLSRDRDVAPAVTNLGQVLRDALARKKPAP
jgi:ribosomal protein S1